MEKKLPSHGVGLIKRKWEVMKAGWALNEASSAACDRCWINRNAADLTAKVSLKADSTTLRQEASASCVGAAVWVMFAIGSLEDLWH